MRSGGLHIRKPLRKRPGRRAAALKKLRRKERELGAAE